jgi:hypothetical protein
MNQFDLFAEPVAEVSTVPTVESVRRRLEAILAPLRTDAGAVSPRDLARWRVVVPQMTNWLPADEAEVVRTEFAALAEAS